GQQALSVSNRQYFFKIRGCSCCCGSGANSCLTYRYVHATIDLTNNGLRVIVDDQSCLQAIAYVKSDLFSTFIVREPSVTFRIPIAILTVLC
uniref:Phospholipid scramblase n=1 Tax=Parascaris equorum TaxID=6256 RepID=A0A914RI37_PAREQ